MRDWESRRERIADLWREGLTAAEIGAELDMTEGAVRSVIQRMRYGGRETDVPYRTGPWRRGTPTKDLIEQMWRDGMTVTEIGVELGKHRKEVSSILARMRNDRWARWTVPYRDRSIRQGDLLAMHAEGIDAQAIADELGYTLGSVRTLISRHR